jgi:hypothetical protein
MASSQKPNKSTLFKPLNLLAGLVLFLLVFASNFRPLVQLLMALLAFILQIWVAYNMIREESSSFNFRTFSFNPVKSVEPTVKLKLRSTGIDASELPRIESKWL